MKNRPHSSRPDTRPSRRRAYLTPLIAAFAALALANPAAAQLTFDLHYQEVRSDPPAWDPDGAYLTHLMNVAAAQWIERLPSASLDVHIGFRWDDPTGGGVGLPDLRDCDGPGLPEAPTLARIRRPLGAAFPNTYGIRFFTRQCFLDLPWFVDTTPEDNAEFRMHPTTYVSELYADNQLGLNGIVPPLLEVGFHGQAHERLLAHPDLVDALPAEGYDLYTVALAQVGRALGLGFRARADVRADGDYDIFVGSNIGVEVPIDDVTGRWQFQRLTAPYTLLSDALGVGSRRLPSALDAFTVGVINGWVSVNHARRFHKGESSAFEDSGWYGTEPHPLSVAVLAFGDVLPPLFAFEPIDVHGLFVSDVTEIDFANVPVDAGQILDLHSEARVHSTGLIVADQLSHSGDLLSITNSGTVQLQNYFDGRPGSRTWFEGAPGMPATLLVPEGRLRLRAATLESMYMTAIVPWIHVNLPGAVLAGGETRYDFVEELVNNGLIRADAGDLEFVFAPVPERTLDLDGVREPETGRVDAINGSVSFDLQASDPFNALMRIGADQSVTIPAITVGDDDMPLAGGTIRLGGDLASINADVRMEDGGRIEGAPLAAVFVNGGLQVFPGGELRARADGFMYLMGDTVFWGALPHCDHQGRSWRFCPGAVDFSGSGAGTAFPFGALATGSGTLVQVGDLTATPGSIKVSCTGYRWDGEGPLTGGSFSETRILSGSHLIIKGNIATSEIGDGYDGTVTIEAGGTLQVDNPWILEGSIILEGGTVTGGAIINRGTISGNGLVTVPVTNEGNIDCDMVGIVFTEEVTHTKDGNVTGPCVF